ncbi:Brp/Blh family beta-carotene 15,15'-dioxygenase [uncultured Sphingomonas sp.]|uniref:Brp/Blh family beta-carotene 15,15'-dioxygenase n=1 Tax=uncultured Sphingomonas sp. TaxID=158754 RepID=UPI00262E2F9D|nr:Brp/Blh family beta-carotene 15,15'-dioxygenase [uncultured Sphingomonas sp.]
MAAPSIGRPQSDRSVAHGRLAALGWSVLGVAAIVASFAPLLVQLGYAIVAVGVIGMAHGASDLAIVDRARRPGFLALYGVVSLVCLWWWTAEPAVALPLFLLASAIHFALEDAPSGTVAERAARGVSLIATPAVLHRASLHDLLVIAGGPDALVQPLVTALALTGGITAVALLLLAWQRRDARLATGTLALLVFPPLIGFSLGFLILHALPQTAARQQRIGCASTLDYVRAVAPILLLAFVLAGVVGAVLLRVDESGVRALFAAIAALAVPHLLVTPWFAGEPEAAHLRTA